MSSQTVFITKGSTNVTCYVDLLQDNSGTNPGDPLTGLVYNSASLVCYYVRPLAAATQLTLATQTVTGAHSDGGFVEVSSANAPGKYRLDLSDAICASGVDYATVELSGFADLAAHTVHIVLTSVDLYDAVRGGMTALPNAAAEAAGGLFTRGTGAGQINQDANGRIDGNIAAISQDATAADNAESFFDGTGYAGTNNVIPTVTTLTGHTPQTGDSYPEVTNATYGNAAIKTALDSIAASPGVGARPFVPTTITVTSGTGASGTAADMANDDSDVYTVNDSAGTLTLDLDYQLDAGTTAIQYLLVAAAQGVSDDLTVQFYDQVGLAYDTIDTISGANSLTYANFDKVVVSKYTTNTGLFQVRITGTGLTSATLTVNKAVAYGIAQSAGITNGSTITLAAATTNSNLIGRSWTLALGGQDISGTYVYQSINVSGTATCTNGAPYVFQECNIQTVTLSAFGYIENSSIASFTATSTAGVTADTMTIFNSKSGVQGAGAPPLNFSGVTKTTYIHNRNWFGGVTYTLTSNCVLSHEVVEGGTQTLTTVGGTAEIRGSMKAFVLTSSSAATTALHCDSCGAITVNGTGGTLTITGSHGAITDNSSGTVTITDNGDDITDKTGRALSATGADLILYNSTFLVAAAKAVWTDTLTTYTDGMAGKRLKGLSIIPSVEGTINDLSATTTSFITTLTGYGDDFFNESLIIVELAADSWQARPIDSYTSATGAFTLLEALTSAPADGDAIAIIFTHIHTIARMQAGLATEAKQDATDVVIAELTSQGDTNEAKLDTLLAGITVTDAGGNKIADHVLRRAFATAAASADGDAKSFRSLLGAVAKLVNKVSISGTTLTITEADDTTSLGSQTLTTDASAAPITGADTD